VYLVTHFESTVQFFSSPFFLFSSRSILLNFPTIFSVSNPCLFAFTTIFTSLLTSWVDRPCLLSFSFSLIYSFMVFTFTFLVWSIASTSLICSSIFCFRWYSYATEHFSSNFSLT
jgi:hypothetical protein